MQSDTFVYRKKRQGSEIDAKDVHVSTRVRNVRVSGGFMKLWEKERDCREITERHRVSGGFGQSWAEHKPLTDTLAASAYSYRWRLYSRLLQIAENLLCFLLELIFKLKGCVHRFYLNLKFTLKTQYQGIRRLKNQIWIFLRLSAHFTYFSIIDSLAICKQHFPGAVTLKKHRCAPCDVILSSGICSDWELGFIITHLYLT